MKPTRATFASVTCALFLILPSSLSAQQAPSVPRSESSSELRLDSTLRRLATYERDGDSERAGRLRESMEGRPDGRVMVEVARPRGTQAPSAALLRALGAEPRSATRHLATAWVAPADLLDFAQGLPEDAFAYPVWRASGMGMAMPLPAPSGETLTGSDAYLSPGPGGEGIKIGIIDFNFDGLDEAAANGWGPTSWTEYNYGEGEIQEPGNTHGSMCVQTVFDHAPEAEYHLFKITWATSTLLEACDQIADLGLDVVSYSVPVFNTGYGDDSGDACEAAELVTDAGGLFFTAGGNLVRQHWQGAWASSDGDEFLDWVPGDEAASYTVPPGKSFQAFLQWDVSVGAPDYDLFVTDSDLNIIVESDNSNCAFECTGPVTNDTGQEQLYFFVIRHEGGPTPDLELFLYPSSMSETEFDDFEYQIAAGSIISPANSHEPNVISIGAVEAADYGTGVSTSFYSSQGPTHGGLLSPDFVAPTRTDISGGGWFIGTSCSAPNAAGTAAALWSSAPYLDATGVRLLLKRQTEIFKDWGAPGKDNVFGNGGLFLFPWQWGTRWVDRAYGDEMGVSYRTYKYVGDARDAAPDGGRLAILGGSYPEAILIDKELLIVTVEPLVTLGD